MAMLYVASSKGLAKWGSDHGLTKYLYKVGVTDEDPATVIERFNAEQYADQNDWKLAKKVPNVESEEARILARITAQEKLVDPDYYPGIHKAQGIVKVKLVNVESRLLVQQTLKGEDPHLVKVKNADIIDYLAHLATREIRGGEE
jgi:hypothetical protein